MAVALNPNPQAGPDPVPHPPQTKASTCNATIAGIAKKSLSLFSMKPTHNKLKCCAVLFAVSAMTFAFSECCHDVSKETGISTATITAGLATCIFGAIADHLEKQLEKAAPSRPWRFHPW